MAAARSTDAGPFSFSGVVRVPSGRATAGLLAGTGALDSSRTGIAHRGSDARMSLGLGAADGGADRIAVADDRLGVPAGGGGDDLADAGGVRDGIDAECGRDG